MTPTKNIYLLIFPVILCGGCIESAYYHSPLQGNSSSYHAIPVASDSLKSATYANGTFSIGGMNDVLRDNVFKFEGGLHRSHVLNHFRLSYGASIALGSYNVKPYYLYNGSYNSYLDSGRNAGTKFFGAYGGNFTLSAATRLGRRGEWRYIGVEGSLYNEFGNYYSFRKNMPDSQATEIDKKRYLGSLGLTTEVIFKGRTSNKFGIKLAFGSYLRRLNYFDNNATNYYYYHHNDLMYFSNTYHFDFRRTTAWFQFNIATHAAHFQAGVNYRL